MCKVVNKSSLVCIFQETAGHLVAAITEANDGGTRLFQRLMGLKNGKQADCFKYNNYTELHNTRIRQQRDLSATNWTDELVVEERSG